MKKILIVAFWLVLGLIITAYLILANDSHFKTIVMNVSVMAIGFIIFIFAPAVIFASRIPSKYLFNRPKTTLIIFFMICWAIVFDVVTYKPQWAKNYVSLIRNKIYYVGNISGIRSIKRQIAKIDETDGISKEEADLLFREFMAKRYDNYVYYSMQHTVEDKGDYWTAKSYVGYEPGFRTIDSLLINKKTGEITCIYK